MAVYSILNLMLGLGVLTVGGSPVGWLDGEVEYSGVAEVLEAAKSIVPGGPQMVVFRGYTKLGAVLKASIVEVESTNIGHFILQGTVAQSLPEYDIVFTHTKQAGGTVTISMHCNIIPTSTAPLKFSKSTITVLGVEFRLVGGTMPTISVA